MKNIVIDGQILQTTAWYRGMGKYTMQMLNALSNLPGNKLRLFIIFNANIKTDPSRFNEVEQVCPSARLLHYSLPVPVNGGSRSDQYRDTLSSYLAADIAEGDNYYLITSLFTLDFFADLPQNFHGLILFYDLIPLLFWKDLGQFFPPSLYMARFQIIFEASRIFAISATTRSDLLETFGLSRKSVVNINGGYAKAAISSKKPRSFKVPKEYILFPTGDMPHKNNTMAVMGHAEYCRENEARIPLLITSSFSDHSKQELRALNENILFTDNVSDDELEWLYDHTKIVLFAAKYEGLGLPILDAVARNKPIVCSRIAVFEEISKKAFYYFEKDSFQELALAIDRSIRGTKFNDKHTYYANILDKYTWKRTARGMLNAISDVDGQIYKKNPSARKRIAVATLNPGIQGEGRLAEKYHNILSNNFDIDYYFDDGESFLKDRPSFLDYINVNVFPINKLNFTVYHKYDLIIFILDEDFFPCRVAELACALPGFVIINHSTAHDTPYEDMLAVEVRKNHYHCENQRPANRLTSDNLLALVHAAILMRTSRPIREDSLIMEAKTDRHAVHELTKLLKNNQ
jgi:hypothetical protein